MARYILRRLLILGPQLLGITFLTFVVIRLTPGNPAQAQLGSLVDPAAVDRLKEVLGLNEPLYRQFFVYLGNLAHGDLGESWVSGRPVMQDFLDRLPATLELITFGFVGSLLVAVPLGVVTAMRGGWMSRLVDRFSFGYGLMAGSVPDFWFALILIFVFFHKLGIAAAPLGRLDLAQVAPPKLTGFLTVDSLMAGDLGAFGNAVDHLMLPVATLVFINAAPVLRMTRSSMQNALDSDYIRFARANGLPTRGVIWYALKNALLPIITLSGVLYTILIAGAVLTETIFGWGGIGQYAVQSVVNADYAALQAVVLVTAAFSLVAYLVLDLVHAAIDPRARA